MLLRALAILALLALGAGCRKHAEPEVSHVDDIRIEGEQMTLHTGSVGMGQHQAEATYVLVDASNQGDEDLDVTLAGHLTDGAGQSVGELDRQSLRIPAGESRTFALVDEDKRQHKAGGARLRVSSASVAEHPESVKIEELHVYPDGDRVVVAAYVENKANVGASALVIASFYDRQDRPMKRPSSLFRLDRHSRRGVQFVGPPGSTRATMFIGQIAY